MKKLIITVGISGSGKSTWAHKMFEQDPENTRIINRDKIRELLFGFTEKNIVDYYFRKDLSKLEKEVSAREDLLIDSFLSDDKTVIVDATHLKREYLTRFNYWNVPVELKVFQIQLDEAFTRIKERGRGISKTVLEKQFSQFKNLIADLNARPVHFGNQPLEINEALPPCIIFDIDGTLAHKGKRNPFDYKLVRRDVLDESVAFVLNTLAENKTRNPEIIICTGREETCVNETMDWLDDKEISYKTMFLRDKGDMRADWIIKEEFWRKIAQKYNIIGMFDDRMQVVRRARALGLKVFNVEHNIF